MLKRFFGGVLSAALLIGLVGCASRADYVSLSDQYQEMKSNYENSQNELEALREEYEALAEEYNQYKEETADFVALGEEQRKAELARAEQERIEAEEGVRAAQEEADRLAAEEEAARLAEEALGYETGITYEQLARTPDDYKGKKVKFNGTVLQIVEGTYSNQGRLATDGFYDDVIYFDYDPDILSVRLLDDDNITIYGTSNGVYSYQSIMGSTITLPYVKVDIIEIEK